MLCNKLFPKHNGLKKCIFSWFLWVTNLGMAWLDASASRSHDAAAIKVLPGLQSPLKAQVGQGLHSDSLGWLLVGFRALWAVGWRPSPVSSPMGCAVGKKWCAQAFCHLISEVASHHFCHIQLVRSKSLGPVHRRGIPPRCEYQEMGIFGAILEAAFFILPSGPQWFMSLPHAEHTHLLLRSPCVSSLYSISSKSRISSSKSGPGEHQAFEAKAVIPIGV